MGGMMPEPAPVEGEVPVYDQTTPDAGMGVAPAMARFTIFVPEYDNEGNEIPHVLDACRRQLGLQGFPGRMVIRRAQGDWQGADSSYDTEDLAMVMVDAEDSPETTEKIRRIAEGVKALAGQEAVYVTIQPIQTLLI